MSDATSAFNPLLSKSPRRWRRTVLIIILLMVLHGVGMSFWPEKADWKYDGQLHSIIRDADRIVVRDGGLESPYFVDREDILFEVTDPAEIGEVLRNLQFTVPQRNGQCACTGFPEVDWCRGKERLASTSIQHGHGLRWGGIPGDAQFTPEAKAWITNWLVKHGVSFDEIKKGCGGPRFGVKLQSVSGSSKQRSESQQ